MNANADALGTSARSGARKKRKRSARAGMISSFVASFTASASGWRIPRGQLSMGTGTRQERWTRFGPARSWMNAEILRSK